MKKTQVILLFVLLNVLSCLPHDRHGKVVYDNSIPEGVVIKKNWVDEDMSLHIKNENSLHRIVVPSSLRFYIDLNDTICHIKTNH